MAALENISIRIEPQLKEEFYKLCKENKDIPAKVIRDLMEKYIGLQKEGK